MLTFCCQAQSGIVRHNKVLATIIAAGLLSACQTVDVDGPTVSRKHPQAGTLITEHGRRVAILPDQLNYTGRATYHWPDGRHYEGDWLQGKLQGMGSGTFRQGVYTGQWRDGLPHGHGEWVGPQGVRHVGDFSAGRAEGQGTRTDHRGVFRGQWVNNQLHGNGEYRGHDGTFYEGHWQHNQRHGEGLQDYPDGSTYQGYWLRDQRHGFGIARSADGSTYEGSWQQDQQHGYGTWRSPAQVSYSGTWQAGTRHGYGQISYPDHTGYEGQWQHGQRHGEGQQQFNDGTLHIGQWQHDQMAGQGERVTRSGVRLRGDWQGQQLSRGELLLPDGSSYSGELFDTQTHHAQDNVLTWLREHAKQTQPQAQAFLATLLLDHRQRVDQSEARIWLSRSANAGLAEAQYRLALLDMDSSVESALHLLRQAASQSHQAANRWLGDYYYVGRYVEQDIHQAIQHYRQAADAGSVYAADRLAWLLATSSDEHLADPAESVRLIQPLALYFGHWRYLDTLAAARARLGEWDLATQLAEQALRQAVELAGKNDLNAMQSRLAGYQQQLAYIETP